MAESFQSWSLLFSIMEYDSKNLKLYNLLVGAECQ